MSGAPDIWPAEAADSRIARLDPRIRLLVAVCFVVGVTLLRGPVPAAIALAAAACLLALARIPFAAVRRRLLHVEGFMLVLLVLLPFTTPGEPLLTVGPLAMSRIGLVHAVTIALKVNAAVFAILALVGSLEPVRLGRAAAELGAPPKLVHLFLFMVRYVGVFRDETRRLREAMRARGFVARSNLHTWRTLGNLAGLMLVRSLDRAERVEEAMRCRGFSGRLPPTPRSLMRPADFAFAAVALLLIVGMVAGDRLA